jgi:hypothetical protein
MIVIFFNELNKGKIMNQFEIKYRLKSAPGKVFGQMVMANDYFTAEQMLKSQFGSDYNGHHSWRQVK